MRRVWIGPAAALIALCPVAVRADAPPASPAASPSGKAAPAEGSRASMLDGTVTGIDLIHGTLEMDAKNRGRVSVSLPPSVAIEGRDAGYHAITDLVRGTPVQIFTSEKAGRFTAQIIRIR